MIDSVENTQQASRFDGQRSLVLAVQRQPGANTVEVVDRVQAMLPQFEAQLGTTGGIHVLNDRSTSIRAAVHDVQLTLLITMGLVIMVIYLFLGRLGATAIPGVAVPISVISTFGAMYLLGYSIDNISLLALTLSVGLVVDDAIVMLENIVRHVEEGMTPFEAALKGSGEIGFTILSITLSLVAVFIPVLLMGGVVGRVFHEFAVTVTIAIAASAFVSLTLTPMLSARLPERHGMAGQHDRNLFERSFDRVARGYGFLLDLCLRARPIVFVVFLGTVAATVWMFREIPKGFFPQEDIGQLSIQTQARQDISFPAMLGLQAKAEAVIEHSPHVAHVASIVGGGGPTNTLNNGRFFVELKPKGERPELATVVADLRRELGRIPGLNSFVVPVQNFSFGGRQSKSQYQFVVQGLDRAELDDWALRLADRMQQDKTFIDVTDDLENTALQAPSDRPRQGPALGITAEQLRSTLYSGFGSRQISTIYTTGDNYPVIVEFDPRLPWTAERLDQIRVHAASGKLVPLSAFAHVERTAGPLTINQLGQLPAVTVSFNLPDGCRWAMRCSAWR